MFKPTRAGHKRRRLCAAVAALAIAPMLGVSSAIAATVSPTLKLAESDGLVIATGAYFPANSDVEITATLDTPDGEDITGTGEAKSNSTGRFYAELEFLATAGQLVTVTATAEDVTQTAELRLGALAIPSKAHEEVVFLYEDGTPYDGAYGDDVEYYEEDGSTYDGSDGYYEGDSGSSGGVGGADSGSSDGYGGSSDEEVVYLYEDGTPYDGAYGSDVEYYNSDGSTYDGSDGYYNDIAPAAPSSSAPAASAPSTPSYSAPAASAPKPAASTPKPASAAQSVAAPAPPSNFSNISGPPAGHPAGAPAPATAPIAPGLPSAAGLASACDPTSIGCNKGLSDYSSKYGMSVKQCGKANKKGTGTKACRAKAASKTIEPIKSASFFVKSLF